MKITTIFLLLSISFPQSILSQKQKIDSLEAILRTQQSDTGRVNTLNSLANEVYELNPEQALEYATEGLNISKAKKYQKGIIHCINAIGNANSSKGEYTKALSNYQEEFSIVNKIKDSVGIARVYDNTSIVYISLGNLDTALQLRKMAQVIYLSLNKQNAFATGYVWIGNIYKEQASYPLALENYLSALKIFERTSDTSNIGITLINISSIYRLQKQYSQAEKFALVANTIFRKVGNKKGAGVALYRISLIYEDENEIDSANIYLLKAQKIFSTVKDKYFLNLTNSLLGNNYSYKKNYVEALQYLNKALLAAQDMKEKSSIADALGNIANVYIQQHKYDKALEYAKKSEKLFKELNDQESLKGISEKFIIIYSRINKPDSVAKYFANYKQLSDSIYNGQNSKSIAEMATKYETAKKDNEIKQEALLIKTKEIQKKYLIVGISLLALLLGFIAYLLHRRNKQNKELDNLNDNLTKQYFATENLIRVLKHETTRQFSNLKTSLRNILMSSNPKRNVNYAMMQVNTYQTLYGQLFLSSGLASISLFKAIEQLYDYNCTVMNIKNKPQLTIAGGDSAIAFNGKDYLLQYFNELISNSLEHAFVNTHEPVIDINIKNTGKLFEIVYRDNGCGFDANNQNDSSNKGLYLLQSYALVNLSGKLETDFSNGVYYKLTFDETNG